MLIDAAGLRSLALDPIERGLAMATAAPVQPAAAHQGVLARHPLLFFFIIAYAGTWLVWLPLALSEDGLASCRFVVLGIGVFCYRAFLGPFFSAFIMTGAIEGRAGIGRLLRRMVLWRVGLGWYLFVLSGIPAIVVLGVFVLPGAWHRFKDSLPSSPLALAHPLRLRALPDGPLGEEPGWRGFALPSLQRLYGPLVGSLILGPLWALWHLPIFWVPAWNFPPTILNIVLFVVSATAFTIVMTWVFNNTKGSVLIAILVHATFDTTFVILNVLFPAPIVTDYGSTVPMLIGFGAAGVVVVALTRGRLGYQHYRQEVEPDSAAAPT